MKRSTVSLMVAFSCVLFACCASTELSDDSGGASATEAALPAAPAEAELMQGFNLGKNGVVASYPEPVIAGRRSVVGTNTGFSSYNPYLITDPEVISFERSKTYKVTCDYRILASPDKGFEVLFYSPTGGRANDWMPSINITGNGGDTGTAELVNNLGPYTDYRINWNVVGRGSIAVDNIRIYEIPDLSNPKVEILLVEEDLEPAKFRFAQKYPPVAIVGGGYCFEPYLLGGTKPYGWTSAGKLPDGLGMDKDGTLLGIPKKAGDFFVTARIRDGAGETGLVRYRLNVLSANKPAAVPNIVIVTNGDGTVTYTYEPYAPPFRNPLRGMRPNLDAARSHPWASLGRQYIEWNLLEDRESDTVEKIRRATDRLLGDLPAYNIKVIPRVYLEWPPDKKYWPSDLKSGDYANAAFRKRVKRLVARLGEAWNGDPRIAYIEMGIIGDWGEHHHPGFGTDGGEALPAGMEKEIGDAFAAAFPDKLLMHRNPRDFTGYRFGIHWDVFGSFDHGWYSNDSTGMTAELNKPNMKDRWKTVPMGGEIDPTFLDEPNWKESSLQNIVRKYSERLIQLITALHWNHLAVLDRIDPADEELWDKAARVETALGYRFVLQSARYKNAAAAGETVRLDLTLTNAGSSPFYHKWPVEVSLLDALTHKPVWKETIPDIDIRKWLPGGVENVGLRFTPPSNLAGGSYIIALAILDPAGMVPAVRFANVNYYDGGRTPLGAIGISASAEPSSIGDFDDLQDDRSLFYVYSGGTAL